MNEAAFPPNADQSRLPTALVVAVLALPVVMGGSGVLYPFLVPREILARGLIALAFVWMLRRAALPLGHPVFLAWAGLLAVEGLCAAFGVCWQRSLWSSEERMRGLWGHLFDFAFFSVCLAGLRTPALFRRAARLALLTGLPVLAIAIAQRFVPAWLGNPDTARVASTLGHGVFLGPYALFLMGLAAALFFTSTTWRWFDAAAGGVACVVLLWTASRAALLGCLAGLGVAGGVALWSFGGAAFRRRAMWIGSTAILSVLSFLLMPRAWLTALTPGVARLLDTTLHSAGDQPRLIIWQTAWRAWREYPLLGWGGENFLYAADRYFDPRLLEAGSRETWFDHPHSSLLNVLIGTGATGLGAQLVLGGVIIWVLLRRLRNAHTTDDRVWCVVAAFFFVSAAVAGIFGIEYPVNERGMAFWLAWLVVRDAPFGAWPVPRRALLWGLAGVAFVLVGVAGASALSMRANMLTVQVRDALRRGDPRSVDLLEEWQRWWSPYEGEQTAMLAYCWVQASRDGTCARAHAACEPTRRSLLLALQRAEAHEPLQSRVYLLEALLLEQEPEGDTRAAALQRGDAALERAAALSPRRQVIQYARANHALLRGDAGTARRVLLDVIADDPRIAESYIRLAEVALVEHAPAQARTILTQARAAGAVFRREDEQMLDRLGLREPEAAH